MIANNAHECSARVQDAEEAAPAAGVFTNSVSWQMMREPSRARGFGNAAEGREDGPQNRARHDLLS